MSEPLVVIQARTGSARLPGKVLLPLGGYPSVVLTAKRAANRGHRVVVATSVEKSDDALCELLSEAAIPFVRGSLHDVLGRYLEVAKDLADDDWLVRLTGDNVFPDGEFVGELLDAANSAGGPYLGTHSPLDGLPYGMSAEAVKVGALREVAPTAGGIEKEHVTLAVRRRIASDLFQPANGMALGHLRCTMDTFKDYVTLQKVFAAVDDPVNERWDNLCEILGNLESTPRFRIPYSLKNGRVRGRLTLGTAQFGLPHYGIANQVGQPSASAVRAIVERAIEHGVTTFDCARAYGNAEERLGEVLTGGLASQCEVITKLDPLADLPNSGSIREVRAGVDASVFRSCRDLQTKSLDAVLLHRWRHYAEWDGAVWKRLLELKQEGVIKNLGASVTGVEEALAALAEPMISRLQIPMNLLDWRWRDADFWVAAEGRPDVEIDVRSVFLQGALLSPPEQWPVGKGYDARDFTNCLDRLVERMGRSGRDDLCVAYIAANKLVTSLTIGVETEEQLKVNLSLMRCPPLTKEEIEIIDQAMPRAPTWLLNPAEWPKR